MNLNTINYDELINKALEVMPEIKADFEKEAPHWTDEKMGPYNLFDIILMPRVMSLLNGEGRDEELRRCFDFFEALANHPNKDIADVIGVGVCEELCSHEVELQRAVKFMGAKTKACCDTQLKD
jgi:hypothetical protein